MLPRKILLLIYHLTDGGAERVISSWADFLTELGYDVTLMTYYPRDHEYAVNPRVKRATLYPDEATFRNRPVSMAKSTAKRRRANQKPYSTKRRDLLAQYLEQHPQDLIIPFLDEPRLISAHLNLPVNPVVTQTVRDSPWDKPVERNKRRACDQAVRQVGSVILQNAEQARYFRGWRFRHVKKYIVHNPLNPALNNLQKTSYGPIKRIIAIGRLHAKKNYPLMIHAIRILRDRYHFPVTLDIYGAGNEKEALQKMIDDYHLSDQIFLRGRINDIFQTALNYDLFIMTSLYEGTPNALLEAMGLGLPCVVTNFRTGVRELITHGKNGYITQPTPKALARQIVKINDVTLLQRIGQQARHDVQRYHKDFCLAELRACVEDLLSQPAK